MAIKARVLHFTSKGKVLTIASIVGGILSTTPDTIPPAYNCDNEKLVVIIASIGKDIPDKLRLFCRELTKQRAQNVAFIIDGTKEAATELMNYTREAGANVIGDYLSISGGMPLKFLKSITDDEKKSAIDWINKIIADITK